MIKPDVSKKPLSKEPRSASSSPFPQTLWDFVEPVLTRLGLRPQPMPPPGRRVLKAHPPRAPRSPQRARSSGAAQARYDAVTRLMLETHQVRVRKWRTSMSGVAWYVTYRDGKVQRLIEAPRPKGPMSAAVFLHEIGHHAIGFDVYKPRCLEEYHAWRWSLQTMEAHGLNITDAVRERMHRSLWYAVQKARRRGIKRIPEELEPYMVKPPSRR